MSKEFEEFVIHKLNSMEEKISEIDTIKEKVSEIDTIKETLEAVKKSVIIIEDKINRDLPALFEVYDLNYTLQKEKEKKIDFIENISNDLTYRIDNLENTVKDHSIMLKKLMS